MPVLAQADIYRWTDAQSKAHFSATPPAGAQRVEVRPQVVERDIAICQREQRVQEYFDARHKERIAATERVGQRQIVPAEERGCLRRQSSQLERDGRFYRQDVGSGPVYLSDVELGATRCELVSRESKCCRQACSSSAGIVILDCKPQQNAIMGLQRHIQRHQLPSYLKVFNRITDEPMSYIGNVSEDDLPLISQLPMPAGARFELRLKVSGLDGRP